MWMHDSGNYRADIVLGLSVGMMIAAPVLCVLALILLIHD